MGINTYNILDTGISHDEYISPSPGYKPLAHFHGEEGSWDDIHSLVQTRLEDDPFASAESALNKLMQGVRLNDNSTFDTAIQVLKGHVLFSQSRANDDHEDKIGGSK